MNSEANDLARGVALEFRRRVLEAYVPRIRYCVSLLSEEQLWHKPGSHNNSVANLLLHLAGNTRQWILAGVGGQDDGRDRDAEFAAVSDTESLSGEEMMSQLMATVEEAVGVVALGEGQRQHAHADQVAPVDALERSSDHRPNPEQQRPFGRPIAG